VCSAVCKLMKQIKSSNGNFSKVFEEIRRMMKDGIMIENPNKGMNTSLVSNNSIIINNNTIGNSTIIKPIGSSGSSVFKWDGARKGSGIEISSDGKSVFLKENAYMFRSIISDTPMNDGVHYWEIVADNRTENELKIGVSTKRDFNYDTAYCDYEYGFAYYGLGQLRHHSNSVGGPFGKKFKKEGVLGCCLDMNKGTLSFALNGEYWGEAYKSDSLKKGPIFVAISLLHQAGCRLEGEKPVPSYFK